MAIEKVKRTWFLVERGELDALVQGLAESKTVHVVDLEEESAGGDGPGARFEPGTGAEATEAEAKVVKLSRALDVLDGFCPPRRPLAQLFVTLPTEMTGEEYQRLVAETDAEAIHTDVVRIQHEHAHVAKRAEDLRTRIARLEPWAEAERPHLSERCGADLGTIPAKAWPKLAADAEDAADLALRAPLQRNGRRLVEAVWPHEAEDDAEALLHAHGFETLGLEPRPGNVGEEVRRSRTALVTAEAKQEALEQEAAKLARQRRGIVAALAHWQAETERCAASGKTLASKRIAVLSGYVLVREMRKLEMLLAERFPRVSVIAEDPRPDENVPVSLGGSKLFAPAQFLTAMFGLPDYFGFDPSPYIFFTFLLFFGLCFGDVVYGVMLLGLGRWLARKSAGYPSLRRFFGLLGWCGLSAIIVGLFTGSWAADLLSKGDYLGEGLRAFVQRVAVVDPLQKIILILGMVLGIGILNQFYGLALLMYREWRKGNRFAALCDGGLWLVFLPGLILLLVSAVADLPGVCRTVAWWMLGLSAVGLVLTQGRHETSFAGKAITGLVSLYGILGTYGTTSFIGDVLSYSRLLALGLTTVIVGMAVNIIAVIMPGVVWDVVTGVFPFVGDAIPKIPFIALLFTVGIMLVGHVGNFVVSILSGFVHSVRLIFVEFFMKFYEGGARPFAPLGAPRAVRLVDEGTGTR